MRDANRSLSIFANYRLHLCEVAIGTAVTGATLAITGYSAKYALIAISLEEMIVMFNHSNLRLNYGRIFSRLVTSPQTHRVHHSREERHLDKSGDAQNFAFVISVWDILAGGARRWPHCVAMAKPTMRGNLIRIKNESTFGHRLQYSSVCGRVDCDFYLIPD